MSVQEDEAFVPFDVIPSALVVLDGTGTIVYANAAWRQFGDRNGIGSDYSAIGVDYLGVCGTADTTDGECAGGGIRAVLDGDEEVFSFDYPCHAPEEKRWYTMRAGGFRYRDRRYVLVLHVDITERKLAERAAEERATRLERVASVLSHDLRNPLAVAAGYADLLAADATDTGIVEDLQTALDRMEAILSNASVLARSAPVGDGERELVDLEESATRAWSLVDTRDATLTVTDSRLFYAEPDFLAHVLENLVRNAVDHGGESVDVEIGPLDDGFAVSDDGPGIPPDVVDEVFDWEVTTSEGGSGLGLAIVRRLVDLHGWTVSVAESEAGGARFEITGVDLADAGGE
jgi:signal transduction histidine kinase